MNPEFSIEVRVPAPHDLGEYAEWTKEILAWMRERDLRVERGDWRSRYLDGTEIFYFQKSDETLAAMFKLRWG